MFLIAEEEEVNLKGEIMYSKAIADPSVRNCFDAKDVDKWESDIALQFERFSYFDVDTDTQYDSQK